MNHAADHRTAELPHIEVDQVDGSRPAFIPRLPSLFELQAKREAIERSARQLGKRRGAYGERYDKPESRRAKLRKGTGMTMAELAKRAQISERTLRNWESGIGATTVDVSVRLESALLAAGAPRELTLAACRGEKRAAELVARQPVRYRCAMTGSTWSGRGLMPKWLRVALDGGAKLADFETGNSGAR